MFHSCSWDFRAFDIGDVCVKRFLIFTKHGQNLKVWSIPETGGSYITMYWLTTGMALSEDFPRNRSAIHLAPVVERYMIFCHFYNKTTIHLAPVVER